MILSIIHVFICHLFIFFGNIFQILWPFKKIELFDFLLLSFKSSLDFLKNILLP